MKITRLGPARPLLSATSLGGSGGTLDPVAGGGLVPTASGSNSWAWASNVARITSDGSNVIGPFVNFASGSNIVLTLDAGPAGSMPSNTIRIHSTGGASFGSNSNAVASANEPGASTLSSRADHVHLGVRSLAHSSNSFSGPVILTASGTLGITSPAPGTYNLSAGTGGSSGSALTIKDEGTPLATDATSLDFVGAGVVASGTGTAKTITISGGGSGALVLLEQYTASASAQLDFTTFISATYDEYLFELVNVLPATNAVSLYMRMGTGAGPTWDAGGNYASTDYRWVPGGSATSGASSAATTIVLSNYSAVDTILNTAAYGGLSGSVRLFAPGSAIYKQVSGQTAWWNTGTVIEGSVIHGAYLSTTAVTGIRFLMSAGNIASGTIRVYGIAK